MRNIVAAPLEQFSPDQLSAFWSGVSAVATAIAAVVAVFTLIAIGRDSRDRSRPIVAADLKPVILARGTSELVVENVGQSVAKNVRVTFDPPLPVLNAEDAAGKVTPFLQRRYAKSIPTLTPGRQLTNVYSVGVPEGAELVNDEPTPDELTVTIVYSDDRGRSYTDVYELSLEVLRNQTESSPSNTDDKGMQRRSVKAIEAIAKTLSRR